MNGQHQLDVGLADGLVEQLVDGGLPFQLAVLVFAHVSSLCAPHGSESQDTDELWPLVCGSASMWRISFAAGPHPVTDVGGPLSHSAIVARE
jgi:hypothetical protein